MTGHQIAEAFVTLARITEERDALAARLASCQHDAEVEARRQWRAGYEAGYAVRKRTEGREGNRPGTHRPRTQLA